MSDAFRFWIHGVNVQIEFTDPARGLYVRRAGWGTQIRQTGGTNNWFHFAIPSATTLDDDNTDYYHAYLRGFVNNHAIVDRVHVREARRGRDCPVIYDSGTINLTGRELNHDFNLPDRRCRGPLVICIHVTFESDEGEVIFTGAGARFEEWT